MRGEKKPVMLLVVLPFSSILTILMIKTTLKEALPLCVCVCVCVCVWVGACDKCSALVAGMIEGVNVCLSDVWQLGVFGV